jgi:hypothetical protein
MPIGSFADSGPVEAETIELTRALMEIEDLQLNYGDDPERPAPYEVKKDGKVLFVADPNINATIKIVDDYSTGDYDGKKFYDKFYLKLNKDTGLWEIGENSKPGYLVKTHPNYGPEHFKNPKPVDEKDFIGFRFEAGTEQREDRSSKKLAGTRLVWNSIAPVPNRNKKKAQQAQEQIDQENEAQLSEAEEAEMNAALG